MKANLLIFGTKNFNNSLDEVKEDLGFTFEFFDPNKFSNPTASNISAIVVENITCEDKTVLSFINKVLNKPILLLESRNSSIICKHSDKITLPINFTELKSKIINLITVNKFNNNSSIKIKNYILDKNEKKLKNESSFIIITEREVQLIELLYNAKQPLSKKIILKEIWKYAEDADTHTVETHIYRLRKKILQKFNESDFIINSKTGYSI